MTTLEQEKMCEGCGKDEENGKHKFIYGVFLCPVCIEYDEEESKKPASERIFSIIPIAKL